MADARYTIDVAAEMTGTETLGELDALIDKLQVGGRKSDDFQTAIKRVTADLEAAKSAAADAAAALAAGNDQYKILEREATRAAKAVERAQVAGKVDLGAAREAGLARERLDAYTGTLKGLEAESAKANAEQTKLENTLKNLNRVGAQADARHASLNQRYEKLQAAVGKLPGPLGAVASQLVGTAKAAHGVEAAFAADEVAAIAFAAAGVVLVAAVAAVTAALVAGYIALGIYAVRQADAGRSAALSREAFAALSAETAAGVGSFDAITAATGQTDAQLVALTKSLRDAGVSAGDMPAALRAAATAEAALGQGGASEFIARIKDGTESVGEFAREVDAKFGGTVAKRLLGLDAQSARFSRLWSRLFDGVNLEPVLQALGIVVDMFDKAHPIAQALSVVLAGMFNPIADHALDAAFAVEAFALGVAISFVKAYIAVKPFLKQLDAIGVSFDDISAAGEYLGNVLLVGVAGFAVLATAIGVVVASFAAVTAGVFYLGYVIGTALAEAFEWLFSLRERFHEWTTDIVASAFSIGVNLVQGMINGISSMVTSLYQMISGAVTGAIDAAKSVLGIASPSKVFAEIGAYTVDGFTGAVDEGAGEAQNSMAAMVDPNTAAASASSAPAAARSGGTSGGGGKHIDLSGATFTFHGVKDAETHGRSMLIEAFTQLLESDAASLGGAPEVA